MNCDIYLMGSLVGIFSGLFSVYQDMFLPLCCDQDKNIRCVIKFDLDLDFDFDFDLIVKDHL